MRIRLRIKKKMKNEIKINYKTSNLTTLVKSSFFRNRYGEINTIDLESIYCRLILLSKHDTRTNFNY